MPFEAVASEPVNAAELSCVKRPAAASERQAVTTSLRMDLRADGRGRLFAPDPPQHRDQQRETRQADEEAAHFACVGVEQDVAGDRHGERDAADLARQPNRPGVAPGIRIALRAICEPVGSLENVDYAMREHEFVDVRLVTW